MALCSLEWKITIGIMPKWVDQQVIIYTGIARITVILFDK